MSNPRSEQVREIMGLPAPRRAQRDRVSTVAATDELEQELERSVRQNLTHERFREGGRGKAPNWADWTALRRGLVNAALAVHVHAHDRSVRFAHCPDAECIYRRGLLDRTGGVPDA